MQIPNSFEILYKQSEIERAIDRVAVSLNIEYLNQNPVFVCVLNGGIPFTWDLMRRVSIDLDLQTILVSRYSGMKGGELQVRHIPTNRIKGRDVLIIDDILDKGVTLSRLTARLMTEATSVKTAVLVDKKTPREVAVEADFVALKAPDEYLVGRGMDYEGKYRHLQDIYTVKPQPC